ncbi:expressed protein [Phakopsora pachyrhizi]|uniref:Expressed protein n=1 Tax=Phakopsora pachyrhizi TaxID=170000 RepID=A0AAV0AGI0_PHAPC|nr:expressed protein [Phakopsora pachyrhizi]
MANPIFKILFCIFALLTVHQINCIPSALANINHIRNAYDEAHVRVFMLDYDGTLPRVRGTNDLRNLIGGLAVDSKNIICINSARPVYNSIGEFQNLNNVIIVGEHGAHYVAATEEVAPAASGEGTMWYNSMLTIQSAITDQYLNILRVNPNGNNYYRADRSGNFINIIPRTQHKGNFVENYMRTFMASHSEAKVFGISIGDEMADEAMHLVMNKHGLFSALVGNKVNMDETVADYHLENEGQTGQLLQQLSRYNPNN